MSDGAVKSAEVEAQITSDAAAESHEKWNLGVKIVLGVAALSWYMLAMTAVYFHTWFEKVGSKIPPECGFYSNVVLVHWVNSSLCRYLCCIFLATSGSLI